MDEFIEGTEFDLFGKRHKVYSEQYAIKAIYNNSQIFRSFYNTQRNKLGKIMWLVDNALSANMRCIRIEGFDAIITKSMPIEDINTFDTAHEIQHLIFGMEGYPSMCYSEYGTTLNLDMKYIASVLNTVNDPMVNKRLATFGFDLLSYYNKASRIQKIWRQDMDVTLFNKLGTLLEVCLYIQKSLDWDIVAEVTNEQHNKFIEWYDYRFPNISKEAKPLIKYIKDTGYDTQKKCEVIFKTIIKQFGQEKVMCVTYT